MRFIIWLNISVLVGSIFNQRRSFGRQYRNEGETRFTWLYDFSNVTIDTESNQVKHTNRIN